MDALRREPDDASARRFGAASRALFLVSAGLSLLAPLALWLSGLSSLFWSLCAGWLPRWPATAVFAALVLALLAIVLLPTGVVGGFALPRAFGLSRQTLGEWLADWLKGSALATVLGTVGVLAFYACLALLGPTWWLGFAAVATAATLALTFVVPYLVLPLFFRVQAVEDEALAARIRALFAASGTALAQVVMLDFSRRGRRANAAVVGLGRSRRVVLTDTLLAAFSADEVDGVVAHELGHHALGHIPRLVAIQIAVTIIGAGLGGLAGPGLLARVAGSTLADRAALPLLVLAGEAYALALLPVTSAWSRALEREADRFACTLTARPRQFASALHRLGDVNLVERTPPRWATLLCASHPPLGERIAAALRAAGA